MILLINGHPNPESFCHALTEAYARGARSQTNETVVVLHLHQLNFDLNLHHGYRQRTELGPDLERAMALLKEARHTAWIYPVWWGSMPALLKGFFDRVFLPGHFFRYHKNDPFWDKLMRGRSARVLMTAHTPSWYEWLRYGAAPRKAIKRIVLGFVGYRVKLTQFDGMKNAQPERLQRYLQRAERLGRRDAARLPAQPVTSPQAAPLRP